METSSARAIHDPAADFYIDALKKLQDTGIPFLGGGAFAFSHYSHVPRDSNNSQLSAFKSQLSTLSIER